MSYYRAESVPSILSSNPYMMSSFARPPTPLVINSHLLADPPPPPLK